MVGYEPQRGPLSSFTCQLCGIRLTGKRLGRAGELLVGIKEICGAGTDIGCLLRQLPCKTRAEVKLGSGAR